MINEHLLINQDQFLCLPDRSYLRYRKWSSTNSFTENACILFLPGRGTALEKFNHFIPLLASQGFDVWSFDWRGQGLSKRETGERGYIDSYTTYLYDLDYFIKNALYAKDGKRPVFIVAHSMGGHIALRYIAEHSNIISGALLISPMFDIKTGHYPKIVALQLARFFCKIGWDKKFVFGQSHYNPAYEPFEGNFLTRNAALFHQLRNLLMEHPELILGGPTFGWVKASFESIKILMNQEYLSPIKIPIHIIEAGDEQIVDNSQVSKVCSWMENCTLEVIPDAKHQLLSELPDVQQHIFKVINEMIPHSIVLPAFEQEVSVKNVHMNNLINKVQMVTHNLSRLIKKLLSKDFLNMS